MLLTLLLDAALIRAIERVAAAASPALASRLREVNAVLMRSHIRVLTLLSTYPFLLYLDLP